MTSIRSWVVSILALFLVAYPLTFGPACWMASRGLISEDHVAKAYRPLVYLSVYEPTGLLDRWGNLGTTDGRMTLWLYVIVSLSAEPLPGNPDPPPLPTL